MPTTKIGSSDYSAIGNISYSGSAANQNLTRYPNQWSVTTLDTQGATGHGETTYQCNWLKWHGYYREIPVLAAIIDKKAMWTIQKFKITGSKDNVGRIERIKGFGKDTFKTILYNAVRTYTICGDFFAEIIKDNQGRLINIKPLNPGSIKIITDEKGILTGYEQTAQFPDKPIPFDKDEIFHIPFNRIADEIHGISTIQKLEKTISMIQEIKQDMRVIFHRYVKPIHVFKLDTDDPAQIADFKVKADRSIVYGENMYIPKDAVEMERISIPQFSTLDPLPWIRTLEREFIMSEGTSNAVLGISGMEDSEASVKIIHIGWEQLIKFNQSFLEDHLKSQLGIDIKFEFEGSIAPELTQDTKKDGKIDSNLETDPDKKTN